MKKATHTKKKKKSVKKTVRKKKTPVKRKVGKKPVKDKAKLKRKIKKSELPHPDKLPLGVWPKKHVPNIAAREPACAKPIEPAYWALPPWEDNGIIKKEMEEDKISCYSFFGHECRDFDASHDLISKDYKEEPMNDDKNQKLMLDSNRIFYSNVSPATLKELLPGAVSPISMKYAIVMAKNDKEEVIGSADGFLISANGKNAVVIMHSALSDVKMKHRYCQLMLYCSLVSALFNGPAKMKLDYVLHATEYPRLENQERAKETLGRMIFLGRGLGMSAMPIVQCRQPWGKQMPLMLAARRIGKESEPFALPEEIGEITGLFYSALLITGIVAAPIVREAFAKSAKELMKKPKGENIPFSLLPHSPDTRDQVRELGDMMESLGTLGMKCGSGYADNQFCLEYLALLEKHKENILTPKQAVEIMRTAYASQRNDPTPKAL